MNITGVKLEEIVSERSVLKYLFQARDMENIDIGNMIFEMKELGLFFSEMQRKIVE